MEEREEVREEVIAVVGEKMIAGVSEKVVVVESEKVDMLASESGKEWEEVKSGRELGSECGRERGE